ncbi:MAG: methionyl-tRNA formyltransferase [Flavobacteriales bacterium]|nr:methionyl-tRNA formyltransferase [Flavobacteriales bacterium]
MSKQRIVFMGTPAFAVASLDALMRAGVDVAAVVTAPDRPAGRGQQPHMSAVKEYANSRALPVLQPEKLRDPAFLSTLDGIGAVLYVVVAFRMLPEVVWMKPPLGTINLHASLLPAYRGAAPINWVIINGETRTGVTTFLIQKQIDTGDILGTEEVDIGPEESAGELHDRLAAKGAGLLVHTVEDILQGRSVARPQAHLGNPVTLAPKLTTEGCRIDWGLNAHRVHDFVRGLSPHPGAWTTLVRDNGITSHFKILLARIAGPMAPSASSGTIRTSDSGLLIACAQGWLLATEVQAEGKRRMPATDFIRGAGDLSGVRML